ncbi:polysaccharide biosynthesis protein PslH [Thermoflexales bacterium]|nr:polysaccharide biosynthesis protein PslH [Thermoflexales bacterium]
MRILVLSTWYPYPPDNGSKSRAYYLVQGLAAGHDVTLIAFRPRGTPSAEPPANIEVVNVSADPFRYVNLPQWIKYLSPIPLAFWPSRPMQRVLDEASRTTTWDAVVAIQTPVAQYATHLAAIPRVIDIDTSFSYQLHGRLNGKVALRAWLSWQKTHRYETRMFRRFQAGSVVSPKEINFVRSMVKPTACRVEIVPNGVDCQHHQPATGSARLDSLIYNGALTYSANFDAVQFFLAEIYPQIKRERPTVSLTVTGSTQGVDLTRLRLDDSVYLSGYLEDMRPVVGGSTVCIVPIRQGSGTRLKILEAMALGTSVVSTTKGAEGIDARHGDHLLVADDAASFADCTLRLLRDVNLRQRLAANARRLVEERYDWTHIGQHFTRLVEDSVQRQRS